MSAKKQKKCPTSNKHPPLSYQSKLASRALKRNISANNYKKTSSNYTFIFSLGTGDKCFANSCYKFVKTGKTWDENQDSCKAEGGDLVSMETEPEWEYVNSEIQQITLPEVNEWHIGLKKQGTWKWVSGKPLTIKKWQRYEPSGDGNAAVMSKDYPSGSRGLFNDLSGQYPKPYICEMPSGKIK